MIHSRPIVALLDANVLYPAPLRDLLLHLANFKCYRPLWTSIIHAEWIRNLLKNRPDLQAKRLERTREAMNIAFPDANVTGFESLIKELTLPDENDRHVLAAAIKGGADVIVTFNIKDFPESYLTRYDIMVQHPDSFVCTLIENNYPKVKEAINNQVKRLKAPPQTIQQLLDTLSKQGLKASINKLKERIL